MFIKTGLEYRHLPDETEGETVGVVVLFAEGHCSCRVTVSLADIGGEEVEVAVFEWVVFNTADVAPSRAVVTGLYLDKIYSI